jgi:hypothetical protein
MAHNTMSMCCPNADVWGYGGGTDAFLVRMNDNMPWVPVDEITKQEDVDILIYPNPADRFVKVQLQVNKKQDIHISIYSVTGQKVFERTFRYAQGIISDYISLERLNNGIYFLQIRAGESVINKKIIKQE